MGYWERLRNYMQSGPAAIDGWPEPIPIAEFNKCVADMLGAALVAKGFELVADRRWVRSGCEHVKDIFEFKAAKGLAYVAVWGFSLDFVPHVAGGGQIKWHRTAKSAQFDLVYSPADYEARPDARAGWTASPASTREELQDDLNRVTRLVLAEAVPFWASVQTLDDVLKIYLHQRSRLDGNMLFNGYPQQCLALAFLLARLGKPGADAALAEFVQASELSAEVTQKLEEQLANSPQS